MEINRNVIKNNIKIAVSKAGLTMKEVEPKAGVSVGFTSRLSNDNNNSISPLLNLLLVVSELSGISIDLLLFSDLSQESETEQYLQKFGIKALADTNKGKLGWNKETIEQYRDYSFRVDHPLFCERPVSDCDCDYLYNSSFNYNYCIRSDCYNTKLPNGKLLYLMNVCSDRESIQEQNKFELYFVEDKSTMGPPEWEITPICYIDKKTSLYRLFNELYKAADEASQKVQLDSKARSYIDDFMKDIPF